MKNLPFERACNQAMPETTDSSAVPAGNALQLHDARPFFDKVLAHGVRRGIIDAERLAAINADAPKGIVQIARYFGSEFLRPELEKARDRMVNMISLYLLETTGGDLDKDRCVAARQLVAVAFQRRVRHAQS